MKPYENIFDGIRDKIILQEDEGILLRALEAYEDKKPGEKWMIYGPRDFLLPIEVQIVESRKAIPLGENEGIYIRNIKDGEVKLEQGPKSCLLDENQEYWEKVLSIEVQKLLNIKPSRRFQFNNKRVHLSTRSEPVELSKNEEAYKAVTFKAPHNSAVQLFDYKS